MSKCAEKWVAGIEPLGQTSFSAPCESAIP